MIRMSNCALVAGLMCAAAPFAHGQLIISEIVDATLPGGNPKFVEITNTSGMDFMFTGGGIIVQSNANTDLDIDVDLNGITISAGQSFVIASSQNDGQNVFESTYGFAADLYSTAFFGNGDDRYILSDGMGLVDIFGAINIDGTGEAWEYTDSYAFRNADAISGNGGVFDIVEWTLGGVDALEVGGDDSLKTPLIQSLTTPGTHNFVPTPGTTALLALGGIAGFRRRR